MRIHYLCDWKNRESGKDLFRISIRGEIYKYHIRGFNDSETVKGDPFAHFWEQRPKTASITWDLDYKWKDEDWMKTRKKHNSLDQPWSVYEVHLASWMRPSSGR